MVTENVKAESKNGSGYEIEKLGQNRVSTLKSIVKIE